MIWFKKAIFYFSLARDDSSLDKTPRKIFRQKSSFELRSIGSQAIKSKVEFKLFAFSLSKKDSYSARNYKRENLKLA